MLKSRMISFLLILTALTVMPVTAQDSFYNEAPILAQRVAAGELSPVDARMPANPLLVTPDDEVGQYGGTWHVAQVVGDVVGLTRLIGYEGLVRWDPEWARIVPNVAQSWEVNEDSTEYTFQLREGIYWSDGQPFTADDILFWYEDVESFDSALQTGSLRALGNIPYSIEKVDDYTVVFRFDESNGTLLPALAAVHGAGITKFPKHHLSQFHPSYNDDLDALIEEAGVEIWTDLFNQHAGGCCSTIPGTPTLNAWMMDPDVDTTTVGQSYFAVRNPYYWKIDTDFNQLPYIDELEIQVVEDRAGVLELAIAGQIDMQFRNVITEAYSPQNQAAGGYGTFTLVPTNSSQFVIYPNLSVDDPVKREMLQNRDFRIGLSYAIDRQALADFWGDDVFPVQDAPIPSTPYYNEQYSTQYIEHDVDLANEYLDRAGYSERDADGNRLGPDGTPIQFTLTVPEPQVQLTVPIEPLLDQIQADWEAVGIQTDRVSVDRIEFDEGLEAPTNSQFNAYDITVWDNTAGFEGVTRDVITDRMAPRYTLWFREPASPQAQEPPAAVIEILTLFQQAQQTADLDLQVELLNQAFVKRGEEFLTIGTVSAPFSVGIVKPNFRNVPEVMIGSWIYPNPAPTNPSQYFIAE